MNDEKKKELLSKLKHDNEPEAPKPKPENVAVADLPIGGVPQAIHAHIPGMKAPLAETPQEDAPKQKPISVRYEGCRVTGEFTKNGWNVEFYTPEREDAFITPTLLRQLERAIRYNYRLYQRGINLTRHLAEREAKQKAEAPQGALKVKEHSDE